MIELIPYIISQAPGSYVLTKRISQDLTEAFFGQTRKIGRRNKTPDISQYSENLSMTTWQKYVCQIKGSNVDYTINWADGDVSSEKLLPKRRKKKLFS